jgi:catechol 2,3-dioxygenase-like lactoylglutathione lyase family enzyme
MKRTTLFLAVLLFCVTGLAQETPKRPPILGIGSVSIAAPQDVNGFYTKLLGFSWEGTICASVCYGRFGVNSHQRIELINRPPVDFGTLKPGGNYLVQMMFETSDIDGLRRYLESRGTHPGEVFNSGPDGANPQFSLTDPEGHHIGFIQFKGRDEYRQAVSQVSEHLIHVGFVVHDRAAEDRFYKDILGFHPYWHGGMKDGQTEWVDMQVPDGTDWIEYMLNVSPDANHHTLGVMNHIALGVPDIHVAQNQLLASGMKLTEEPHIGRGGKWQLNLYDPDDTRVELMEFTPVQKPCCSEYTGPHPKP